VKRVWIGDEEVRMQRKADTRFLAAPGSVKQFGLLLSEDPVAERNAPVVNMTDQKTR
jgi:hypothetical protein